MTIDEDRYIGREEAAKLLGVTGPTVWRYVRNGANGRPPLPAIKLNRKKWMIKVSELNRWVSMPTQA